MEFLIFYIWNICENYFLERKNNEFLNQNRNHKFAVWNWKRYFVSLLSFHFIFKQFKSKLKQNRTDLKFRHKVVDIRSRGWWRFRKRKILATETIIYLQFLGKIICKIRFHLFPFICAFCLNADRFIKFMNLWLENCMKFFSNEKLYFFYLCEWKIRINFHKIWR